MAGFCIKSDNPETVHKYKSFGRKFLKCRKSAKDHISLNLERMQCDRKNMASPIESSNKQAMAVNVSRSLPVNVI